MLAPIWNNKIELLDGWYSISDIEYPFEYILKKDGGKNDNRYIKIVVKKIENRIIFKIKIWSYLEL